MLASLVALAAVALAATSASAATTHTVMVGMNGTKTFTPSEVTAAQGDIVNFMFVAGNHTATQSTFAAPCTNAGFKSGFKPATAGNSSTFAIMINSTDPVWVYCGQTGHCQAGMVMAINAAPTGNKTFSAFQAFAMGSTASNTTGSTGGTTGGAASGSAGVSISGYGSGSSPSSSASSSTSGGTAPSSSSTSGGTRVMVSGAAALGLVGTALGLLV